MARKVSNIGLLILLTIVGYSGLTSAQLLEEVVVTAQKREQSLQDVPISVTAFNGSQIRELGFNNSVDLVAQTPGVEITGYGGGAVNSFSIRGSGQNDFAAQQEAPVATYVDEAYISSNIVTRFSLFDLERAEVLRGPQGTLYGRNATGGLVHYVTAKPSQEFDGFIDVELGEDDRKRFEGAIGGGITENLSGRLSGNWNKRDGLITNDLGGDSQNADDYSIRGQLLFEQSDTFSALLKVQYADEEATPGGNSHIVTSGLATDFFGYADADGNPYTVSKDFGGEQTSEFLDVLGRLEWDLGNYTVTSVTNYQDMEMTYAEDSDLSPASLYHYQQFIYLEQFSQEVRVSWEGERHRSVVGVYYLNIDTATAILESGDVFFGPGVFLDINSQLDTEAYAIFGQTEYDLNEQITLTVGIRYNHDKKDFSLAAPNFGAIPFADSFSDDDWSGKVQLDYRPNDDWLLYFGISRGIKSGGYNIPLTPTFFDPALYQFGGETLVSYEAGFKAQLSERVRINASAFYYDYEDYQAFNIDPSFNNVLFNATAENYGGEVELTLNPVDGLDILLGVAYLDTEITDLPVAVSASGRETAIVSPEWAFNGLVRYTWPAFNGNLAIQGDFSWRDDQKYNLVTTPPILEDAYGLLNARLSYTTADDDWTAAIFVRNLTDEYYNSFATDATAFFGSSFVAPGVARWVGGSIRYNF